MSPRRPLFPPVMAPTTSHTLVDDFSLRAARQRARQAPPGMPTTHTLRLRNHPMWSGNNELGRAAPFAPDADNRQLVLKMNEYGEPTLWTVSLGLQFDIHNWVVTPPNLASFDLTALISFGVGGVVQEVEVDWINGAAIALPANAITVTAQYNPDQSGDPTSPNVSEPPEDLLLRCSLAMGMTPGMRPTRSTKILVSNGDSGEVPIPPFAKSVLLGILSLGTASAPFTTYSNAASYIEFMSAPPSVFPTAVELTSYSFNQCVEYLSLVDGTVGNLVPLSVPTGARTLVIHNNGGTRIFQPQFLIGF